MRANARSAAGEPASTPTNFDTAPPALAMPLSSLALSSGAVSSSWMSKRLMSVLTVMGCGFTLLLASYLPHVSYSAGIPVLQSRRRRPHTDYECPVGVGSITPAADMDPPPRGPRPACRRMPPADDAQLTWRTGWPTPQPCERRPRMT